MRVLMVPASYAPVLGGLQTVVRSVAEELDRDGDRVEVVTHRHPRTLPVRERLGGVDVTRLFFLWPSLRSWRRPDLMTASVCLWPSTVWALNRLCRRFRPDVINVHFPDGQIPFIRALRRRHAFRLVISVHGDDVERYAHSQPVIESGTAAAGSVLRRSKQLRAILNEADAVTGCSEFIIDRAARLEPSVRSKATVIYNGIDPARFAAECTPAPVNDGDYIFAFGRLSRVKGFDLLLQAFASTEGLSERLRLFIAGTGEEEQSLKDLTNTLGIGERVSFLGRLSPEDVVRYIRGSRFCIMPSHGEAFGIAAIEVLAAGKPLLATSVGGIEEACAEAVRCGAQVPFHLVPPNVQGLSAGLHEMQNLSTSNGQYSTAWLAEMSWQKAAFKYQRVLAGDPLHAVRYKKQIEVT